ncbi:exo-alpha-sialidase [Hyphomicrobium sp. 99]|uniref:WD40/YVTN/BNR-like repeat-containing protein n=1 Tax=Hyphomicrobium sp. 99 TaxID=1163419 RepID=UPI001FDA45B6|nr:exo-alpha-sialidase [Hyphomicrobium sp. 99]
MKLSNSRQSGVAGWQGTVIIGILTVRLRKKSGEETMTGVRVLVGTRKGAFILTADGTRKTWDVSGPHFAGWEIYHLKGSRADPNRIYASQSSSWFGQQIQRSDDGGKTWEPVDNKFAYDGVPGTHQWYDGTPHPWEFKRVWHLEPSITDPDTVFAGVEDAALFRSSDGGKSWAELSGLRGHGSGSHWMPGAGGMCLHTILLDPVDPKRMFIAISAAGAFRTDDGGETWQPINKGLKSEHIPDPHAEVGHCVHHLAMHPSRPDVLFMQKHWDVMRSNDAGNSWHEVSGNLPTDFGFAIDVHAHEPETIYVVPIKSDAEHFPIDGKLQVWRSRSGGQEWEALTKGLPQTNCYVNVLRDAMAVDTLDTCGVYFGTTGGQVYASPDAGDTWSAIVHDLPPVLSVEVQTLA